jgi:mRNA-degrading endonuclease RelE of RelBE toxin-antitoxin system
MAYAVFLKRTAKKELEQLPRRVHDKIVDHLLSLRDHPHPAGADKLHGREGYRIGIGDYLVLYVISNRERTVEIVSVAHRKEVYR